MSLVEVFNKKQIQARPKVRPGDLVRVHQKDPTKEGGKAQIFEGVVIARKHGFGKTATITVRRESGDVAVEKIYPLHSPVIERIEVVQRSKVRQAKLYYLREASGKKARLKRKETDLEKIEHTQASQEKAASPEPAEVRKAEGIAEEPKPEEEPAKQEKTE